MKCVAISGGSGFVGSELKSYLIQKDFKVKLIKREDLKEEEKITSIVEKADILINLSGANIISRWSESYKKILRSSRIDTTKSLVNAIKKAKNKPELFISTSAVGIYDNKKCHDENSLEFGDDFLAKLCMEWENEAFRATSLHVRTCVFRFGIVFGDGGALKKMLPPFKLGLGGNIGSGKQYLSFIHIKDLLKAYHFMYEHKNLQGIFNLTAPISTTNEILTKTLSRSLNKPAFLPVPEFVLRLIFGEGAKVLTDGQCAEPKRLVENGFEFEFKNIDKTIANLTK